MRGLLMRGRSKSHTALQFPIAGGNVTGERAVELEGKVGDAMLENLKFHLSSLARFSGRETRSRFWPYVGMVFALMMIGSFAVMVPGMASTFGKMQQFAKEHPDQVTIQRGPGSYSMQIEGHHPELMPDVGAMMLGMSAVSVAAIVLLAAAVTRRLHDRGRTGAWGLMPLPFIAFSYTVMPRVMGAPEPDIGLFFAVFASNLSYLIVLCVLLVLLIAPSDAQENKYGLPEASRL